MIRSKQKKYRILINTIQYLSIILIRIDSKKTTNSKRGLSDRRWVCQKGPQAARKSFSELRAAPFRDVAVQLSTKNGAGPCFHPGKICTKGIMDL